MGFQNWKNSRGFLFLTQSNFNQKKLNLKSTQNPTLNLPKIQPKVYPKSKIKPKQNTCKTQAKAWNQGGLFPHPFFKKKKFFSIHACIPSSCKVRNPKQKFRIVGNFGQLFFLWIFLLFFSPSFGQYMRSSSLEFLFFLSKFWIVLEQFFARISIQKSSQQADQKGQNKSHYPLSIQTLILRFWEFYSI